MPSQNGDGARTKLLIVCPENALPKIRRTLFSIAPVGWERGPAISILPIANSDVRNATLIGRLVHNNLRNAADPCELIVVRGLNFEPRRLSRSVSLAFPFPTVAALEGRILDQALQKLSLDWISTLSNSVVHWIHGSIDRRSILEWLTQFDVLGGFRWVGERLLRTLDVLSESTLCTALRINADGLNGYTHLCVVNHTPGKSGAVIGNLIRKRTRGEGLEPAEVEEFSAVLNKASGDGQVLLFEDGLFTGTELVGVFESLLNQRPPSRELKAQPLEDVESLYKRRIVIRCGVVANFGRHNVERFFQKHGLRNVFIAEPVGDLLRVLSEEGLDALNRDELFIKDSNGAAILRDPDAYMTKIAFSHPELWRDVDRVGRAVEFCRGVGSQLWRSYLRREGREWSDARIDECGLGMRSQALTLAFAHSVPKGTLPLFWAEGDVAWRGNRTAWRPLFPNAY